MSMNLAIKAPGVPGPHLYQTPTSVTNEAMKIYRTGSSGDAAVAHALKTYMNWLRTEKICTPGEAFAIEEELNAFFAFVPGASFISR